MRNILLIEDRRAKFTRTQVETLVRLYNENVEPLDGRRQIRGVFQYQSASKTKHLLKNVPSRGN